MPSYEEGKPLGGLIYLGVNEDFEGKRNAENLYKRVKCKVYFAILQRVLPNFGYQIYFLVTPILFTLTLKDKLKTNINYGST